MAQKTEVGLHLTPELLMEQGAALDESYRREQREAKAPGDRALFSQARATLFAAMVQLSIHIDNKVYVTGTVADEETVAPGMES